MTMYRILFVLGFVAAPTSASAWVLVGHPVPVQVAPGTGLTFTSVDLPITNQVVEYCVGSPLTFAVDDILGIGDLIGLPVGEICSMDLYLDGPVVISGTGNGGSFTFTLNMQAIHVTVSPSVVVTQSGSTYSSVADAITLASTNWVTATSLGLSTGVHRDISVGDSGYYGLRDAVRQDSSLAQ